MTYLSLLLFLGVIIQSFAQPLGWNHKKTYLITEPNGTLLLDYQVKLHINTQALIAAGQLNANGSDIRFGKDCNGATLFNYWIESGLNTNNTIIWVKMDSLKANTSTSLYMYYGNNSASSTSNLASTFVGPHSATDSVSGGSSGGFVNNAQRGFRFIPNQDILITDFGKNTPDALPLKMRLFDNTGNILISEDNVIGNANTYTYTNLTNHRWLIQNTTYVLTGFFPNTAYQFGASGTVGSHLTYVDMLYCNSCSENTFPTSYLTNIHYGYVDFWYYTRKQAAIEPIATEIFSNLQVSLNADTICFGDSLIVSPQISGGSSLFEYLWTSTAPLTDSTSLNITAKPTISSTYTINVKDIVTCQNESSSLLITVNPLPNVNAGQDITVCEGSSTILTATGDGILTWDNGVSNGVSFTPTTSNTYTVTATSAFNCLNTDSMELTMVDCTGNNEVSLANFKLYPNPASDFLNIETDWSGNIDIRIMDVNGKTIIKKKFDTKNQISIELSELLSGTYFITCKTKTQTITKSFIRK